MPEVYTLSRAAHAHETAVVAATRRLNASSSILVPSYNDLLDERSARSNMMLMMDVSTVAAAITDEDSGNQSACDERCSPAIEQLQPECTTAKGCIREKRQPKITGEFHILLC